MTTSAKPMPKEFWLNIYNWPYDPCFFWHESREKAEEMKSERMKLIYRIHVRLK